MGTSKQPANTTQTTKVQLPAWVENASQQNYQLAEQIANKPYNEYTGTTLAPTSLDTIAAQDLTRSNVGATNGMTADAVNGLKGALAFQPSTVRASSVDAGQLANTDLSKYMNPYLDSVEKYALGATNDARVQALMGNADKAVSAGAFGGSRSGIVDAVTNAESIKDAGALSAGIRSAGYDKAMSAASTDIGNRLSADQFNASGQLAASQANAANGITANGQRITGALGMNNVANDAQNRSIKDITLLGQSGAGQTASYQNQLDDLRSKWEAADNYDTEGLNLRLASLGMSPYGKTETATKTTSGGKSGTDWASAGTGLVSLLAGIFGGSDENSKTDVQEWGKDEATGLTLYSYRYKGDPKTYPKVVGPMAQDVEKKYPGLVRTAGGKKVVRMDALKEMVQ